MKTCPICKARCFDDMVICYGCMYRFDVKGGEPRELLATLPLVAQDQSLMPDSSAAYGIPGGSAPHVASGQNSSAAYKAPSFAADSIAASDLSARKKEDAQVWHKKPQHAALGSSELKADSVSPVVALGEGYELGAEYQLVISLKPVAPGSLTQQSQVL